MMFEGVLTGKCLVCMQYHPGLVKPIKSHLYGDGLHRNLLLDPVMAGCHCCSMCLKV